MAGFLGILRNRSQYPEQSPASGFVHPYNAETTKKEEAEEKRRKYHSNNGNRKQHTSITKHTVDSKPDTGLLKNEINSIPRTLSQKNPAWRRLSRSRSRKRSATDQHAVSNGGDPPPIPSRLNIALSLPLELSSECLHQQIIDQISSLEMGASAYTSSSECSEPDSIFEPQSRCSTKPSPASTISINHRGYREKYTPSASTAKKVDPASTEEPISVDHDAVLVPMNDNSHRTNSRLSKEMVESMRSILYADSESSLCEDEAAPSFAPEQTSVTELDEEARKRLSDVINKATAQVIQYTENLQKDTPPPIPRKSSRRNTTRRQVPTDSVPVVVTPSAPALPIESTTDLIHNGSRKRSANWMDKQPQRIDSLTRPSSTSSSRPYTRPDRTWYTTHERFMEVFDDIPSVAAGVRRENPKIYHMRKRRVLLEMGLTERDLIEAPKTKRGKKIMVLLDRLEERLQNERREEARSKNLEDGAGPAKKHKCVGSVGAHCVNDVRWNGYMVAERDRYGNWVSRSRDWTGGKGKGKGKAVAVV